MLEAVKQLPETATNNALMYGGAAGAWAMVGVEWMNDHAGFFVALGAVVSTAISIWGACRSKRKSNRTGNA